jgi:hypothetical protein
MSEPTPRYKNYSRVRLVSDRFQEENARRGDIGYIIEIRSPTDYEVEFSEADGTTRALIVAKPDELEVLDDEMGA